MTNFRIKYTNCVSKIARETNLEIKIAKLDIFAQGDASEVGTIKSNSSFIYIKSLFNLCNE